MSKELEALSSEQAQDLAALEAMANDVPLLPGQEPPAAPVDPVTALGEEIAGIVLSVVAVLAPALPCLPKIYTPETTKAAGLSLAGVCVKHGWLAGGLMGEWSEEITAAVIILPLAVTTYQGVKGDVARLKIAAKPAETPKVEGQSVVIAGPAVVAEQPGGASVSFGAAVPA